MISKTKDRLLFLLGVAICFAVAGVSVFLEELIPGGLEGIHGQVCYSEYKSLQ